MTAPTQSATASNIQSVIAQDNPVARPISCLECRKKKRKCDRKVPCSSCVARGKADTCQLDSTFKTSRNKNSIAEMRNLILSMADTINSIDQRLGQIELRGPSNKQIKSGPNNDLNVSPKGSEMHSENNSDSSSVASHDDGAESDHEQQTDQIRIAFQQTIDKWTKIINRSSPSPPQDSLLLYDDPTDERRRKKRTQTEQPLDEPDTVNKTSSDATVSEASPLAENETTGPGHLVEEFRRNAMEKLEDPSDSLFSLWAPPPSGKPITLDILPDKPIAEALLSAFWTIGQPLYHVVHRPTFEKEFAEFCAVAYTPTSPPRTCINLSDCPHKASWISLLLIMLANGFVLIDPEKKEKLELHPDFLDNIVRASHHYLLLCDSSAENDDNSIIALINAIYHLSHRGKSKECWDLVGVTIRLAQGIKMHRDGTELGLDAVRTNTRRRIWTCLCILDKSMSLLFVRPYMIHTSHCSTLAPEETKCEVPGTCDYVRFRYQVALAMPNLADYILAINSGNPTSLASAFAIDSTLLNIRYKLPQSLQWEDDASLDDMLRPPAGAGQRPEILLERAFTANSFWSLSFLVWHPFLRILSHPQHRDGQGGKFKLDPRERQALEKLLLCSRRGLRLEEATIRTMGLTVQAKFHHLTFYHASMALVLLLNLAYSRSRTLQQLRHDLGQIQQREAGETATTTMAFPSMQSSPSLASPNDSASASPAKSTMSTQNAAAFISAAELEAESDLALVDRLIDRMYASSKNNPLNRLSLAPMVGLRSKVGMIEGMVNTVRLGLEQRKQEARQKEQNRRSKTLLLFNPSASNLPTHSDMNNLSVSQQGYYPNPLSLTPSSRHVPLATSSRTSFPVSSAISWPSPSGTANQVSLTGEFNTFPYQAPAASAIASTSTLHSSPGHAGGMAVESSATSSYDWVDSNYLSTTNSSSSQYHNENGSTCSSSHARTPSREVLSASHASLSSSSPEQFIEAYITSTGSQFNQSFETAIGQGGMFDADFHSGSYGFSQGPTDHMEMMSDENFFAHLDAILDQQVPTGKVTFHTD